MRSHWSTTLLLAFLVGSVTPAAPSGRVGQPAPPLDMETLLQVPEGTETTWAALRGQAVVLEFWATWCGPCVQAISHLNALDEALGGQPVRFLSITDENETTVAHFLEKRPMAGWVGLDTDRSAFDAYDVVGLPMTVLVDPHGVVRAVTIPQFVTLEVLRDLLAGSELNLPERTTLTPDPTTILGGSSAEPLFHVSIRPSTSGRRWGQFSPVKYLSAGTTVEAALARAHEVPWTRVVFLTEQSQYLYDIAVLPAGKSDLVKPLLRQALEAAFRLQARREIRERDVHVVVIAKGHEGKLQEASAGGSGFQTAPGRIEGVNMTAEQIARALEFVLGSPVVDETALEGTYDVRLLWDRENSDSLAAKLREHLGLELREARREIEVLVVEKTPEEAD